MKDNHNRTKVVPRPPKGKKMEGFTCDHYPLHTTPTDLPFYGQFPWYTSQKGLHAKPHTLYINKIGNLAFKLSFRPN